MKLFQVPRFHPRAEIVSVTVPASKSILSRVLLLAAFLGGRTEIRCGALGDDIATMIDCLRALGVTIESTDAGMTVQSGKIHGAANLCVRNSGTVARFLTAALAVRGGNYHLSAGEQMQNRPMELLNILESCGVKFVFEGKTYHFPFQMHSEGISRRKLSVATNVSTQFASGLLLAGGACGAPLTLHLSGNRTNSSYLRMTQTILTAFGATFAVQNDTIRIKSAIKQANRIIDIEPDVSAACYFYALALLCRAKILVRGIRLDSIQGDLEFLSLLESKGVILTETAEGILADGSAVERFTGFEADLRNFSDQALTVAAIAPFATSPSRIFGISHIRAQECDRIRAISENLEALGVPVVEHEDSVTIYPADVREGTVKTFGDHRVAMAFALMGLKTGNIYLDDVSCVSKTFPQFFDALSQISD